MNENVVETIDFSHSNPDIVFEEYIRWREDPNKGGRCRIMNKTNKASGQLITMTIHFIRKDNFDSRQKNY